MVRKMTSRPKRRGARPEGGARQNRYSARNFGRPARRMFSEDSRDGRLPALFRTRRFGRNGLNRRRRLALGRENAFSFGQNSKRRRPDTLDGVFARRIVADRLVREQQNCRLQVSRFSINGTDVNFGVAPREGKAVPANASLRARPIGSEASVSASPPFRFRPPRRRINQTIIESPRFEKSERRGCKTIANESGFKRF